MHTYAHLIFCLLTLVYPLQTQFDISVGSELMAILALTTNFRDMKERLGRIVIGQLLHVYVHTCTCLWACTGMVQDVHVLYKNHVQCTYHLHVFMYVICMFLITLLSAPTVA